MADTIYRVKIVGDTSDIEKKFKSVDGALSSFKKEAEHIVLGFKFENREAVTELLTKIKDDVPDLAVQVQFDMAKGELERIREEQEKLGKISRTFTPDVLGLSPGDYKEKAREYIDNLVKEVNQLAQTTDFDPAALKQKIQEIFDINKFFGDFGYKGKDAKATKEIIQSKIIDKLSPNIDLKKMGFKGLFYRGRSENELYQLQQDKIKLMDIAKYGAKKRGFDVENPNNIFDYKGAIKSAEDATQAEEKHADAIKKTGEAAKDVAKSVEELNKAKEKPKSKSGEKGSGEQSASDIKSETDAMNGVGNAAGAAANEKEKFTEANSKLANGAAESVGKIKEEQKELEEVANKTDLDKLYDRAVGLRETLDEYGRRGIKSANGTEAISDLQKIIDYYDKLKTAGKEAFTESDEQYADFVQYVHEAEGAVSDFEVIDEKVRSSAHGIEESEKSIIETFSELGRDAEKFASQSFSGDEIVNKKAIDDYLEKLNAAQIEISRFKQAYTDELSADVATEMMKGIESSVEDASEKMRSAIVNMLLGLKSEISSSSYLSGMFGESINSALEDSLNKSFSTLDFAGFVSRVQNISSSINSESERISKSADSIIRDIHDLSTDSDRFVKTSLLEKPTEDQKEFIESYISACSDLQKRITDFQDTFGFVPDGIKSALGSLITEMHDEAKVLEDIAEASNNASTAKESFDDANAELRGGVDESVEKLEEEGEALEEFEEKAEKQSETYTKAVAILGKLEDYNSRNISTVSSNEAISSLKELIAEYDKLDQKTDEAFKDDAKVAGFKETVSVAEGALRDLMGVDEKMRKSAEDIKNAEGEIVGAFKDLGKNAGRYLTEALGEGKGDLSFLADYGNKFTKAFGSMDYFKNAFTKGLSDGVAAQMTKNIDSAMSTAAEQMRSAIVSRLSELSSEIGSDPTLSANFGKAIENLFSRTTSNGFKDGSNFRQIVEDVRQLSVSMSNFKNNMLKDSDTDALAKLGERISALDDQVLSVRFKGLSKAFENFNPATGSVEKLRSEINALSTDTSKVESDIKSATSSLTSEFNSISGRFKEFVTLSSNANPNVIQTGTIDSFISGFQKLQEAINSFEKEFGFVPENISKGMAGLNEAMQKALVDALSVTSKMKETITSDKYSDSFKTKLYDICQELSKYISEVNGFDSSKMWDVSKVQEYLREIARLVSEFNQLKASASGEDLIKSNSITQRDKDSLQNIRSRVHDITDSELLEGDNGFIKRIANLNAAFKSFDPAKNSISELRSEMKLLKDDIEAAIKSAKKFAAESAKADKQVFGNFEKSTKGMTKVIGKGEDKTAFEKDQWASYIEEYGKAVETAAGRGLSELPKSAENAVNEIAKVISSSVELEQRVKSIQENSGQYTQEYIESLSGLKEAFKTLHDMFPNNDFSIIKKLGLSGEDLDKALKAIDEIMSKVSASTSGKYAEKEIVSKTYERATGLLSGLTDSGLRDQVSGIVDELKNAMQGGEGLDKTLANMSTERLQELNTLLSQIGGQANETGGRLQTFANIFTKSLTGDMASMVMRFTSIRYLWRYAKQMAQATTQIDSAITELRKVSGESNIRLQESFKTSAETAQKLGSTITEVINSTADWARLGYSIDQAEDLARVTQLFKTVGDNMTQETASKSLVSILQGYKIDASQAERTVDSINEVANNFAIDTAGIGDALQRSAASLNAAGTDLNKSIALVTTSNAVLQNP